MIAMLLTLSTANADQCAWIPKETAEASLQYLQRGATWAEFCQPCSDSAPVVHTVERGAEIRATESQGLWEVVVDGKPVDLAYVYVVRRPEDHKLGNLAFLASCKTTGVSKTIPRTP